MIQRLFAALSLLLWLGMPQAQEQELRFISPQAGDVVNGVSFQLQVNRSDVSKVEITADGFRLGDTTAASNWVLGYTFNTLGTRNILARGLNASGTELLRQSLSINLVDLATASLVSNGLYGNGQLVIVKASPRVATLLMKASGVELARNGVRSNGGDFVLDPKDFTQLGSRVIDLEGLDAAGSRVATLSRTVNVTDLAWLSPSNGSTLAIDTSFDLRVVAAQRAVRVVYTADGNALAESTDAASGYRAMVKLNTAGNRTLRARAFDPQGAALGDVSLSVTVPGASTGGPGGFGGNAVADQVRNIAASSSCASAEFSGRGRAPIGFVKGIALSYAKSYCEVRRGDPAPSAQSAITAAVRSDSKDVLFHYGLNPSTPALRLRTLYSLAMGSAMRESAGNTTEGVDVTAPGSGTADTAEAGLYQTSYNSRNLGESGTWLSRLQSQYNSTPANCNLSVFREGVNDRKAPIVGSGAGADFQRQTKTCPSFATEYALVVFRQNKNHYGPLVRKEAQILAACTAMLQQVEAVVNCGP